ncbi:MAG: 5-formyltetrahydrofolate cyclo-ligase [Propionibacteriaceae bacterium]
MPSPDPVTERAVPPIGPTKDQIRAAVGRSRATRSAEDRRAGDEARTRSVLRALGEWRPGIVAAYANVDGEPATGDLIDAIAQWATVLLPVLSGPPGPRRAAAWAVYEGRANLRAGVWGISEPTGAPESQDVLLTADLVIVPGIAGTPAGDRLGTGGGWYDRALVGSSAPRWLLLHDDEVYESLPVDAWDLPVSMLLTERRILRCP